MQNSGWWKVGRQAAVRNSSRPPRTEAVEQEYRGNQTDGRTNGPSYSYRKKWLEKLPKRIDVRKDENNIRPDSRPGKANKQQTRLSGRQITPGSKQKLEAMKGS